MHCMLESERVTYGMPMQYIDLHNKSIDVFGLYQGMLFVMRMLIVISRSKSRLKCSYNLCSFGSRVK